MSAQPVTKDDLDHAIEQSEARLTQRIGDASRTAIDHTDRAIEAVRGEIQQSETGLRGEIQESEARLRGEIQESEARLMQRIAEASEHTAQVTIGYTDRAVQAVRSEILESEARLMQRIAEASEHTVAVMATRIGDELAERMGQELARHLRASDERNLDALRTLDDQYRSLPGDVATLRDDLDACCGPGGDTTRLRQDLEAHASDDTLHLAPARQTGSANDTEP